MSTQSSNVGVSQSWTLVAFAKEFGKSMKVTDELVNSQTGETFKSCAFISPEGTVTLVGFSSKLDSINPALAPKVVAQQIASQKDSLQVVLLESGNYKLCKAGADNWAEVDLGI